MIQKSSLLLGLLCSLSLSFSIACTAEEELTKDEVLAMPIDDRSDSNVDLCEVYGWYEDGECDTFCNNPDPDCTVSCEASDCPTPPEFSPRLCDGGTSVWASAECISNTSGMCFLEIDGGTCPEDRICELSDCPAPPELPSRRCDDDSVVVASAECIADSNGDCGFEIDDGTCPEDND